LGGELITCMMGTNPHVDEYEVGTSMKGASGVGVV
jgi:hypothetical protein